MCYTEALRHFSCTHYKVPEPEEKGSVMKEVFSKDFSAPLVALFTPPDASPRKQAPASQRLIAELTVMSEIPGQGATSHYFLDPTESEIEALVVAVRSGNALQLRWLAGSLTSDLRATG